MIIQWHIKAHLNAPILSAFTTIIKMVLWG